MPYKDKEKQREAQRKSDKKHHVARSTFKRQKKRNRKIILVQEFGGACKICGFNKSVGALEFHHLDPTQKDFHITQGIATDRAREEAKKCILLCSNCHRMYHYGDLELPTQGALTTHE